MPADERGARGPAQEQGVEGAEQPRRRWLGHGSAVDQVHQLAVGLQLGGDAVQAAPRPPQRDAGPSGEVVAVEHRAAHHMTAQLGPCLRPACRHRLDDDVDPQLGLGRG